MAKKLKSTQKGKAGSRDTLDKISAEADSAEREYQKKLEEELRTSDAPPLGFLHTEPESELGKRIEYERRANRLTQGQLAAKTVLADKDGKGLSRGVLSLYELGINRPGPKEIRLLCEVLRVSPSYLIYGNDDPFDNRSEYDRYGGTARSEAELYARLVYSFFKLHHTHSVALMQIMRDLLRGWNKDFDAELEANADQKFLDLADELRSVLKKRTKKP